MKWDDDGEKLGLLLRKLNSALSLMISCVYTMFKKYTQMILPSEFWKLWCHFGAEVMR